MDEVAEARRKFSADSHVVKVVLVAQFNTTASSVHVDSDIVSSLSGMPEQVYLAGHGGLRLVLAKWGSTEVL